MRWGHRKAQPTSLAGTGHRALAGVYGINQRFYNRTGNKTLASMNAAARTQQLKKAADADRAKASKAKTKNGAKIANKLAAKNVKVSYKEAKANLNAAKRRANISFTKAYNYSAFHLMSQFTDPNKKNKADRLWGQEKKDAKALDKAQKDYKKAKTAYKKAKSTSNNESVKGRAAKLGAKAVGKSYKVNESAERAKAAAASKVGLKRKAQTYSNNADYYKKTSQDLQSGKVGKPRNNYQRAMQALGRSKFATRAIINSKDLNAQQKAQALAEQGLLREDHRRRKHGV